MGRRIRDVRATIKPGSVGQRASAELEEGLHVHLVTPEGPGLPLPVLRVLDRAAGQVGLDRRTDLVPRPRQRLAPVVQGIAYLLLILVAGGAVFYQIQPWLFDLRQGRRFEAALSPVFGNAEISLLDQALASDRLHQVDFALQIYYLLYRVYPPALPHLVSANLLKREDLLDSDGDLYGYEMRTDGYRLISETGQRTHNN